MAHQSSFLATIVSGAIAGGLMTLLILTTPFGETLTSREAPSSQEKSRPLPEAAEVSEYERRVIETVRSAQPAVVSIVITQDVPVLEQYYEELPGNFFDSPFDDFFGPLPFEFRAPRLRQRGTETQKIGGGSGFLVTADGMIVTNRHVVSEEDADYTVFLSDGTDYSAEVLARDPVNDIAILKIDGQDLPFLEFGNSDELEVGQTVIAIGNALAEFRNTVSRGIISGLSRSIIAGSSTGPTEQLEEVIQTDAAINPGNSGGPLLDLTGKVIGVNVAVALGSENIGFSLPANVVKETVESVQRTGRITRPYLGIRYIPINAAIQEANNLPVDYGVLIGRGESPEEVAVIPGSPANKAGLTEGDIILEIDGQRLDERTSLASIIRHKNPGDSVRLSVLSKGERKELSVTLEEMPQGL